MERIKRSFDPSNFKEGLMIFESFLVFYLLECLILITAYVLYYKEQKKVEKKMYNPWGFWNEEK